MSKVLRILGTRGIPAQHGGFETFAERLALYLVERGWEVTVYGQDPVAEEVREEWWRGIRLVQVPERHPGAWGTIRFDWRSTWHASVHEGLILTLGYNTAAFCLVYRLRGLRNVINMDGIEWRRAKWSAAERAWLYLNERLGCWFGNHLVADHPRIAEHLGTRVAPRKVTMIPYGADRLESADEAQLERFGVEPGGYALVIARPEPENSILSIVKAFSRRYRGYKLVLLGAYHPERNPFHAQVMAAAGEEVLFPGAVYEKERVEALRFFARLYVHGHTVGGTNPSLVEALGAGSPVLAHDNQFNRWVAGSEAHYFKDEDQCAQEFDRLLDDETELARMREASYRASRERFSWERVLAEYEALLTHVACISP